MPTKKLTELYSWVNFSYIGIAAGVLSLIVTVYNLNKYLDDIKRTKEE